MSFASTIIDNLNVKGSVIGVPSFLLLSWIISRLVRRQKFPPGPSGLPFIGNILDVPKEYEWSVWGSYLEKYGPISSLNVLGTRLVIINSLEACTDLLEKRSTIYAGRPKLIFAGEIIGWNRQMILSQYESRYRTLRRMVVQCGGTKSSVSKFQDAQRDEARRFILSLVANSGNLLQKLRRRFQHIGAIYLLMSHGYRVERERPDPLVGVIEQAAHEFYLATQPGAWIVDLIPFLKNLPDLGPFSLPFQVAGKKFVRTFNNQLHVPHNFVLDQVRKGVARSSFSSQLLDSVQKKDETELIPYVSNTLYGGGLDTVVATLGTFFLVLVSYPEVQHKIQEELDRVVGPDRLPDFEDRENLPYLLAVQKEVMRWHPVGPMGIPHMATADDEYLGYFIPKGATVLTNLWKISRDDSTYADPDAFKPERFLGATPERDPSFVFGFGRRVCPGQELANATVFLFMAITTAVLGFKGKKDAHEAEISPIGDFFSGTVSHPKPFDCEIKIRSPDLFRMVSMSVDEKVPKGDGDKLRL